MRTKAQLRGTALSLVLASAALASWSIGAKAAPVTFFGEDENNGSIVTSHPNSDTARAQFFSHLTGVGTETFESFSAGQVLPLTVSFPGAGTATLTGVGNIQSGPSGSDQFPISGSKFLDTNGTFTVTFSGPISAFGFYGTDLGDVGARLTLGLASPGGGVTTLTVPNDVSASANGSALYFGFYDLTNTYTSISFTGAGADVFGFDDFSVGTLTQVSPIGNVPLPSSLPMFGAAVVAVGLAGYRMKRKGAAA